MTTEEIQRETTTAIRFAYESKGVDPEAYLRLKFDWLKIAQLGELTKAVTRVADIMSQNGRI
jgi:hypothetical protein